MVPYNKKALECIRLEDKQSIYSFVEIETSSEKGENIDWETVNSFGEEWSKFSKFSDNEIENVGNEYFDIVDDFIVKDRIILDVGCGSGRWTKYISQKAAFVEAVDPSDAVYVARRMLSDVKNTRVTKAGVDNLPFDDNSFDLVFSLGVLHHIPDTEDALKKCVAKVKKGGYFLVYLYYDLSGKSAVYRFIHRLSEYIRFIVSKLPKQLKRIACDLLALFIYMPFILLSYFIGFFSNNKKALNSIPLSYYRGKSFNIIRNDALDRFGTPLEQRFSREEISQMLKSAGLSEIVFSENAPYWHAIGKK